jgi:GIY-YIG catalytic domain
VNHKFRQAVESLHPKYETLIGSAPHKSRATLPKKGVYLFSEDDKSIYVGRSGDIPRRFGEHRLPGSGTNKAALAKLIACDELGLIRDYGKGRDKFKARPEFLAAFEKAKERVRAMDFRAVEELDSTRQALLEVYCAVAGDAKYNDFGTH